jgi:predicted RNase H-like HicB family nuclease
VTQGKTRAELLKNLRSALREAIELNREEALAQAGQEYEETPLKV